MRSTQIDEECAAIGACDEKKVDRSMYELLEPLVTTVPDVITKFGRLLLIKKRKVNLIYINGQQDVMTMQ